MSERICPRPPNVERLERVETLCSRFEAEWKEGRDPDARTFLDGADPGDQPVVLRELLLIEWCHREKRGKVLDLEVYRQRFSRHAAAVEEAWRLGRPLDVYEDE